MFNTVPHETARAIDTAFSEGVERFQHWRPWFDGDDRRNILFASVQASVHKIFSCTFSCFWPVTPLKKIGIGITVTSHSFLWMSACFLQQHAVHAKVTSSV